MRGMVRRGLGVFVGAGVVLGSAATFCAAQSLVILGQLATDLESTARRAEEEGLVPPRQSQLRSKKWNQSGGDGGGGWGRMRKIEVRAVNGVGSYKEAADRMLYRD